MLVSIYNLDEATTNSKPVCILKEGEHLIGRGDLLKCNDKRASRTHAIINITGGNATITSTHQNPCFFQAANSETIVILTKDVPMTLQEGDKFGIFPDQYWFKVKVQDEDSDLEGTTFTSLKRSLDADTNTLPNKLIKHKNLYDESSSLGNITHNVENGAEDQSITVDITHNVEENNGYVEDWQKDENITVDTSINVSVREELSSSDNESSMKAEEETANTIEPTEDSNNMEDEVGAASNMPSSSGTSGDNERNDPTDNVMPRERCWYGDKCYRKNLDHKKNFSHPGDPDYNSDPDDKRPVCSFGADCYRKNKDHRKEYKHPPTNKKPRTKRKPSKRNYGEDDYDYDDPFLTDGSEDEYAEESWSEDDNDDADIDSKSGDNDQDDDDTRTLMKEAKRFTKRKK